MVDVGTGLAALGTAEVTKDMIGKMLGPTADYIGEGVRTWTERRTHNVQRVLAKATSRLGNELDRPGAVPPRVLKAILDEAQVADDELLAEYLGGILASSRTENGRDDRAASTARLVSGLSTYAVRTHYIFYASARCHFLGSDSETFRLGGRGGDKRVYLTTEDYGTAMEFSEAEATTYFSILSDTLLSLSRNDLLSGWVCGDAETLRSGALNKIYPEHGIVFEPTQQGISLLCVAHGISSSPYEAFVDPNVNLIVDGGPNLPKTLLLRSMANYAPPENSVVSP
jgi:hypothetical protein